MKDLNSYLEKEWNSGCTVKQAVRRAKTKNIDKQTVVKAFRHFSRTYGYSGMIPTTKTYRPVYLGHWETIEPGLEFCKDSGLYKKDGRIRNAKSAEWAGWIGPGALLRKTLKRGN